MKYFKPMNKKAKIALAVIKKVFDKFPKFEYLFTNHTSKNAAKRTMPQTWFYSKLQLSVEIL